MISFQQNLMKNQAFLIAMHSIEGLGPIRIKKILQFNPDPKDAWNTHSKDLLQLGIPKSVVENLVRERSKRSPEDELEKIIIKGIKFVTLFESHYPQELKEIYDPPLVIFYLGEFPQNKRAMGVVGSRKITSYGKIVTEKMTSQLCEAGFVIVSGLARGVDTVAHLTAIKSSGKTIAVLGGGLNNIFPSENLNLVKQIADGFGAVISEYPPDFPSLAGNFPARNRIIAGLSKAVLVTEAAEDSGSLITAHQALEGGKEVFAVPGPITSSTSLGCAQLIKNGAKLTTSINDILEEFGLKSGKIPSKDELLSLTEAEKTILSCLDNESKHIDQIVRELSSTSANISGTLLKLEISGIVRNVGNGVYVKNL